ncbi:MAG: mevalonate kinase family protein [Candidatus Heimdallarchaeaceae archaeon]
MKEFYISTPGRICLFGEDVDYMGLEVITLAINNRIEIFGTITNDNIIHIKLTDLDKTIEFENEKQPIKSKNDYVFSAFNMYQERLPNSFGAKIEVKSNLSMGKGLSSSSAFCVALVAFFDKVAKVNSSNKELAKQAYNAEVLNLKQAGGMMDHFASVLGNIIYLECRDSYNFERLNVKLDGLIIGDTLKQKETIQTLMVRKKEISEGIKWMKEIDRNFNLLNYPIKLVTEEYKENESVGLRRLLGILGIRNVVRAGYDLLKNDRGNKMRFAELLNHHHHIQHEYLENVTSRMQELILHANGAGALGCKLMGSGNGGSFLAYAPNSEKEVMNAITEQGGEAYVVQQDRGLESSLNN